MGDYSGKEKEEDFKGSLTGKEIPVLTLDNKWYRLLNKIGHEDVKAQEDALNELLRKQGRINTKLKEIKRLKKSIMEEIVGLADEAHSGNAGAAKQLQEKKRLVDECNEKLEEYEDDMIEVPRQIEQINKELMLMTMESCYETMQEYTDDIEKIEAWVKEIRIELKKRLIRKQEMETKNHEIYSYMHDVFGAEVVNLFDMRYNPEEKHPVVQEEKPPEEPAAP
ncbi:MAG: hypothetical protein K5891_03900 [Lachnospiraceae bacterium]|nr:hypothetical protein [Lachnospiraceae bacterium]